VSGFILVKHLVLCLPDVDALCRLTRLQELDVSGNQIQTIVTVGRCGARLTALKELNLGHNRLTTLPTNLSAMAPNLEILLIFLEAAGNHSLLQDCKENGKTSCYRTSKIASDEA